MPERVPSVVIVDDHAGFRHVARELLEARGFDVLGEASGAAGAHMVVALRRPDLVVLDVELGTTSGLDVAWALTHAHPGLRVLLVSVDQDACDRARASACGALAFLPKARLATANLHALLAAR